MFRRNLVPIWVAVLVLSSMYLMGQGWSPQSEPPAPVPKTGQTASYATGDDGDLQMGVASPSPRFTDNGNGAVTDNLTGLIWTKDADCDGKKTWNNALSYCNALANGTCGLSDGSVAGDWRLPNVRELYSLIDYGTTYPALPTGHPFTNVGDWTWVATTVANTTTLAWDVSLHGGSVFYYDKDNILHAWCVRGGQ